MNGNTDSKQRIPLRVTAAALFTVLVLLAFGGTALFDPGSLLPGVEVNEAVTSYSQYFAGRQLVLAVGLIALILMKEARTLGVFLVINGFVQTWDGALGLINGETNFLDLSGPMLLAAIDFWAAWYLLRRRDPSPAAT